MIDSAKFEELGQKLETLTKMSMIVPIPKVDENEPGMSVLEMFTDADIANLDTQTNIMLETSKTMEEMAVELRNVAHTGKLAIKAMMFMKRYRDMTEGGTDDGEDE